MKIEDYFNQLTEVDEYSRNTNREYFSSLYDKYLNSEEADLVIYEPENDIQSYVVPAALLKADELPVTHYEKLSAENTQKLKEFEIILCKMHAGIGSSVKRAEYLKELTGRESLGAKGTDLFIEVNGKHLSLAQLQIKQAQILDQSGEFKKVWLQNLINEETFAEINKLDQAGAHIKPHILQLKVPTLQNNELTTKRLAPAGHAYLGFSLLSQIFQEDKKDEIYIIGNGEDLNSTADHKILTWIADNDIPITMITTTKLAKDKKGGQISLVKDPACEYITIVEKAQAEKSNQLAYFEQLGLRENDNKSLFNTNIVVINAAALKDQLAKINLNYKEFQKAIAPALIKNTKEQKGEKFVQLEGAIGSVMLNLDYLFRKNGEGGVVHFLNLDPHSREKFFIPIKTMDDFLELQKKYCYNSQTGRLDLKES